MSSLPESTSLQALLKGAAFAPIAHIGWVRVTGEDRVRWLNGMTTNSVQSLKPGEGCYTFFLNAQGRIQADANVWMQDDAILLETGTAGALATMLDRFIIMDDVELEVLGVNDAQAAEPQQASGSQRAGLSLGGPDATRLLDLLTIPAPLPLQLQTITWQSQPLEILHAYSPLVPTFELWSDPATIGLLAESLRSLGAAEASPEALTQLRILSGVPLFGTDIRDRDLPQETAATGTQSRALHFAKGCYLGQEIVERIHSRGNVHRTFTGFILSGELPAAGTPLALAGAPDKAVGEITSVAQVGGRRLALGYVRRDALTVAGQTATPSSLVYGSTTEPAIQSGTALPVALPFVVDFARPVE